MRDWRTNGRQPRIIVRSVEPPPLPTLPPNPLDLVDPIWRTIIAWFKGWKHTTHAEFGGFDAVVEIIEGTQLKAEVKEMVIRALLQAVINGADYWESDEFEKFANILYNLDGNEIAERMLSESRYDSRACVMLHFLSNHLRSNPKIR